MEDVGKALIMAGQVLLFALACTVSIMLYSSITNAIDNVLLAKDYSNRGDAIVGADKSLDVGKDREVEPAEVVLAILDLKNKNSGDVVKVQTASSWRTYNYNASIDYIGINGLAGYPYNTDRLRKELKDNIIASGHKYKLTYSENELIYSIY